MATACSQPAALAFGPLRFDIPVVQAALSGYSDGAMRPVARKLGAPYTLAEVMLDQLLLAVRNRRARRRILWVDAEEHPVGGQLMGAEPDDFARAARELVDAGFDAIDINFGCPVRKVLGRCRGGYHLSQPDVALAIVSRVRDAVPDGIPVTVKMRRGMDDSSESRQRFFTILDGAFERGAAAVTVHARTVKQRYDGPARWEFLREVKCHAGDRIILGSGDLFSARACLDMLERTGVDGVSVARGAIGNPWIFSQIRALLHGRPLPPPPTILEQRSVIEEHYNRAAQIYGEVAGTAGMRKLGIKYSRLHPEHTLIREQFARARSRDAWTAVLDRWYRHDGPGCFPPVDEPNPWSHDAVTRGSMKF